ncbi:MAG: hypothetical protein JXB35_14005 [Anaerolineae bacterium]|nr:hypothetical protein [Anaerolineae bacterium]
MRLRKVLLSAFAGLLAVVGIFMMTGTVSALEAEPGETVTALAAPQQNAAVLAATAMHTGSLLYEHFGVTLTLQAPYGGGTYLAFDWNSFVPTKHTDTVDWTEGDWYGNWNLSNFNHTDIQHPPAPGTADQDWYSSGTEWYDVEAIYFDNDAEHLYLAIVTSVPFTQTGELGIVESRVNNIIIRTGDLAISLFKGTARDERGATTWHYNYGLDLVHDNRDQPLVFGAYETVAVRDYELGKSIYRTTADPGGSDVSNPANSDWYTSIPRNRGATQAHWEHTNFDPLSTVSRNNTNLQYMGEAAYVNYYEYEFPGGQLENNAPTYVLEVIIPRSVFGEDRPAGGDAIGFQFVEGCRNDGNESDGVLNLIGDIDDEDFGDAPDPLGETAAFYPTLLVNDGARHRLILNGPFMGAAVDAENDGQPDVLAAGDDASDDEDGVVFTTALIPGSNAGVAVDMTASPAGCLLNAWIDFNGDGDWSDSGEQIFTNEALTSAMVNTLTFPVPSGAPATMTYARFRCSTQRDLAPTGQASDGEVEDYYVVISEVFDFGDAPHPAYPTLLAADGARHIVQGPFLGAAVDAETEGQSSGDAGGDDGNGVDDEDGVAFTTALVPGDSDAGLSIDMSGTSMGCLVNGWLDFNADGDWLDAGEHILIDEALAPGDIHAVTFAVPDAISGAVATFARFRCSTAAGLTPTGPAPDGEVEDYAVHIEPAYDWGDAPDSPYPTTLASGGARHALIPSGPFLGARVDADTGGQPTECACGDDMDTGAAGPGGDEDGVAFTTPLAPGATASVAIDLTASPVGCLLSGWIDFNGNGDWLDAGEQIYTDQALSPGSIANLTFPVPSGATSGWTHARFRCSTQAGLTPVGVAPDGEVEDYRVMIGASFDFGDADRPTTPRFPHTYPSTMVQSGAYHLIAGPFMGVLVDADADGQPNTTATGDDGDGIDDEDGVALPASLKPGAQAAPVAIDMQASPEGCLLNAWIDFNGDGDWNDSGERIFADAPLAAGMVNALSFAVPDDVAGGIDSYARFRCSTTGGLLPVGGAPDGEVEDYLVTLDPAADWGDLPDVYGTLSASAGAMHIFEETPFSPAVFLGSGVDPDPDGQPDAAATGDNTLDTTDDETGVAPVGDWSDGTGELDVTVSGGRSCLSGWIDFWDGAAGGADGDFGDGGEQVLINVPVNSGTAQPVRFSFSLPAAVDPDAVVFYARFRLVPDWDNDGVCYDQLAPGSTGRMRGGEVEDYRWTGVPTAVTLVHLGVAPAADGLRVTWETAMEVATLGFNLYRAETLHGPRARLNAALIPAQHPGTLAGGTYSWSDATVVPGMTYFYWLEDVDAAGAHALHGPVSAEAATPSAVAILEFRAETVAPGHAVWWMVAWIASAPFCRRKR